MNSKMLFIVMGVGIIAAYTADRDAHVQICRQGIRYTSVDPQRDRDSASAEINESRCC